MPHPQDGHWPKTPKPVEDWFRLEAKSDGDAKRARLHVFGPVGGWFGLNVHQLVRDLDALDVDQIDAFIDSGGGDAFAGIALRNALRRHKATVTVRVDGLAASAASIIAMGGDEVVMSPGSQMMVHEASGARYGRAADMTAAAKALENMNDQMAAMYAEKANGTAADWREAMRVESWYTAAEAVEAGLADRAEEAKQDRGSGAEDVDPESIEDRYDLAMCAYAGRAKAPRPIIPTTSTVAAVAASPEPGDEQPIEKEASMALMDDVRQRLGVDAEADEAAVLAALDARLARPNVPEGTTLVESAQLEALQADAAAGRQARDAQLKAERESLIEAAVRDGRIAPARREHWAAQLEADAGLAEVIAGLPQIINTAEKGYTGGVDEAGSDDDRIYAKAWGSTEKKGA